LEARSSWKRRFSTEQGLRRGCSR